MGSTPKPSAPPKPRPPSGPKADKLLKLAAVAELIDASRVTAWRLITTGAIDGIDVSPPGAKKPSWRVSPEALQTFLSTRTLSARGGDR